MSPFLKILAEQFGFADRVPKYPIVAPTIDPEEAKLAEAELNGSIVIANRRDAIAATKPMTTSSQPPLSPVNADGTVNFDIIFAQAGLTQEGFTADQAARVVTSVEGTIPAVISDPKERNEILRKMILATTTGPAAAERIAYDAQQRHDTLTEFKRTQLNLASDYIQKTSDAIQAMEAEIAAKRAAIDGANKLLSTITESCNERQQTYARVIDLLSEN